MSRLRGRAVETLTVAYCDETLTVAFCDETITVAFCELLESDDASRADRFRDRVANLLRCATPTQIGCSQCA